MRVPTINEVTAKKLEDVAYYLANNPRVEWPGPYVLMDLGLPPYLRKSDPDVPAELWEGYHEIRERTRS